jgi:redox-sensitive bicupin YhaK (pirin superfamily)
MRVFGYNDVPRLDPFLLLDHFGSRNPEDYLKGFPWHPHRGIETVTYMWAGEVAHGDSLSNSGVIRSGDVQWMTAGSGIIHQEMPRRFDGLMQGFQLWVNLPATQKMIAPRYRGITRKDVPTVEADGTAVKVIAGALGEVEGPVHDLAIAVDYFDVALAAGTAFIHPTPPSRTVFAYLVEGTAHSHGVAIRSGHCAVFSAGDAIRIETDEGARFLVVVGEPLNEPVAWGGPIVMNTAEELAAAFQELNDGTFIKTRS